MAESNFTAREIEILAAVMRCLKTPAVIDFDKLAIVAGFKNGGSARACYTPIKKKLEALGPAEDGSTQSTPKSKDTSKTDGKTASAKKRKNFDVTADDDDEEVYDMTPVSRRRKKTETPAKSSSIVSINTQVGAEHGGDEIKVEDTEEAKIEILDE